MAYTATLMVTTFRVSGLDWFRWRGPDLNGVSRETGWSTKWPMEGPKQLWKANVGIGFSSVSVREGRVYTMGNADGQDTVFCFRADTGDVLWKHSYPCGLRPQYYEGGTSATPTLDAGVYTLSKEGHLFCLEPATGKVVWQKHLVGDLGATMPRWGFAGSPLVQDDLLILNAGPAGMAVDKGSGKVKWFSGEGPSGYATPVPIKIADQACVLLFSAKALVCVSVQDGRELWRYPWVTRWDLNVADPIVVSDDRVFISSFDKGAALLKVGPDGASEVWSNKDMANHFTTCVQVGGFLYGINGNTDKPPATLSCLEWATGNLKWKRAEFGFGSLMAADSKLIVLSEKGELLVAKATPEGFLTLARAQVLGGKCWTMPVLSNGRIYCRNAQGTLVCVEGR